MLEQINLQFEHFVWHLTQTTQTNQSATVEEIRKKNKIKMTKYLMTDVLFGTSPKPHVKAQTNQSVTVQEFQEKTLDKNDKKPNKEKQLRDHHQ